MITGKNLLRFLLVLVPVSLYLGLTHASPDAGSSWPPASPSCRWPA